MICPPDHKHGETGTCYKEHRCRCDDCCEEKNSYQRERGRRIRGGVWNPLVDAAPVAERVRELRASGMTLRQISAASGVPAGSVSDISRGQKMCSNRTANRLLAVRRVRPDGVFVPGVATCRMLRALMLAGWSLSAVVDETGLTHQTLTRAVASERQDVKADTADLVSVAAERMLATTPPMLTKRDKNRATFARNWARKHGYAPLAAYDDIHNIRERPKGVVAA